MDPTLVEAVTKGDYSTVERLISRDTVKVKAMDPSGEHILHIAANSAHSSKMIELLTTQLPSHINIANDDGITPLHVACMYGQLSAVRALIESGADPFAVDNEGMTPMEYCNVEGHTGCIEYFQDLGINQEDDQEAEEEDSMAISYALMETTITDDSTLCYTLHDTTLHDTTLHDTTLHDATLHDATLHDATLVAEDELQQLTNSMIRSELIKMGEKPGPVNDLTRAAYLRYLHKVKNGLLSTRTNETNNFKYELALCLSGTLPVPDFSQIEKQLFSNNKAKTGNIRNCFNYLLIDPRVTEQVATKVGELQRFKIFVQAIFYIGKGQKDRPLQHLVDAKESQLATPNKARSTKLQRILEIWKEGKGVVSVHCFHSALSIEAFTREACMVEAIGLPNLTNIRRGQCGGTCQWTIQKRRQYGVYLLHKAYNIYSIEGEQEIYPYNL